MNLSVKTLYKLRRAVQATLALVVLVVGLLAFPSALLAPSYEQDDSELRCIASAIYHEARGEPTQGKRAVLEVIYHRASKSGKTICEVVAQKQQFPWFKKKGLVALSSENLLHYNQALNHKAVLRDESYIFFNGVKPPGHACKKIGRHIFCKEKK